MVPPQKPEQKTPFIDKLKNLRNVAPGLMPRSKVDILKMYMDEALKDGEITQDQYTEMLMPYFGELGEKVTEQIQVSDRENFAYGGTYKDYMSRGEEYKDLSFEEWLQEDKPGYKPSEFGRTNKAIGGDVIAVSDRDNFYAGGVVRLAKLLSDQGKTINEIFKEISIRFKELGGGREGKPGDKTGVTNILKQELGEKVYKERYAPGTGLYSEQKRYGEDIIKKFKELRLTKTESDIEELLGLSPSYQTKLARDLGLEKKSGSTLRSEKFTSARNVETEIDNLIDFNKGRNENLEEIFEKVKDKEFLTGRNRFGKPTKDQVQRYISQKIMNKNQLSVDGYKQEIMKMLEDRSYVPQGLDPLGIKTEKLTNYNIPNYMQAKEELAKEIPGLKKRMSTNIAFRKKLKRKEKEKADPVLKIGRLATKARTKQTGRLNKLEKAGKLSDREEVINWTQTAIQKVSNDQIKKNPTKILAYLKANPDKLKMLGTRVDPATGDIYYENPNLSFLNDNPKDSSRFFEMDHNREISKGDFLLDVPENRASVPRLLNSGFKRDAEKFLESNPNPNDPKVKKILEEAKKLRVRLKPNVEKGIFKSSDFFDYGKDPVNKINDTISFWTPDFKPQYYPVKKDSLGKIKLGTIGTSGAIAVPTVGYTENDYTQIKQDLISTGQMQSAAIEDVPKNEIEEPGLPAEAIAAGTLFGAKYAPQIARGTKNIGKGLLKTVGSPLVASGFAGSEIFESINPFNKEGEFLKLKEDPNLAMAGAELLLPDIAKRTLGETAKRKGILGLAKRVALNPYFKLARGFTPVGATLIAAEGIKKLYDEEQKKNRMIEAMDPEEKLQFLEEEKATEEFMSRQSAAYGGRMGFADGPEDPKKRKFMKIMGGLASLPLLGRFIDIGTSAPKVAEVLRRGADGIPDFLNDLITKVITFGKKRFEGTRADELEEVYELDEFVVTKRGDKTTIREVDQDGDMLYKENQMEIEIDPETGGVTYNEASVRPDGEGKLKDVEEYIEESDLENMRKYTYDE